MDNAKEYIESGILELYVLGELNVEEQANVEAMVKKFPQLKQEIEAIEIALEKYALLNSINPGRNLERRIVNSIEAALVPEQVVLEPIVAETNKGASLLPLSPDKYTSKIRALRFSLVACVSMLILSVSALYFTYSQLGAAKDRIFRLNAENQQFTRKVNTLTQHNLDLKAITEMDKDPAWKVVNLNGTSMDPKANMIVYWHISGKHVMINNSNIGLPPNDKDHQYQLWALVNGKPVDLGVFDVKPDTTRLLINMKDISSAQTFAVTLEKRGGSANPTMDQMIVAGNVSGTL